MSGTQCCDICGGIEDEGLECDEDGLWICSACRRGLVSVPVGEWAFVTQWADGTTVWRGEKGSAMAFVTGDEDVHIRLD